MDQNKEILMKAVESAETKLQQLETEQADLDGAIEQKRNEIRQLEKAIASFKELEGNLPDQG